jgi:hypothetical protein
MKLIYLAHPLSGREKVNRAKAKLWLKHITESRDEPAAVIAPWITESEIWDDSIQAERVQGLERCAAVIERCDELWMCGGRISEGMRFELDVAQKAGLTTVDLTELGEYPPGTPEEIERVIRDSLNGDAIGLCGLLGSVALSAKQCRKAECSDLRMEGLEVCLHHSMEWADSPDDASYLTWLSIPEVDSVIRDPFTGEFRRLTMCEPIPPGPSRCRECGELGLDCQKKLEEAEGRRHCERCNAETGLGALCLACVQKSYQQNPEPKRVTCKVCKDEIPWNHEALWGADGMATCCSCEGKDPA